MEPKKPALKSKSGSEKKSGPWRPTRRQALWAVGTLLALVTIALLVGLLVVNLDSVKWEDLSRGRIEQVALFIGIAVALTTLFVLLAIGGASLGWTGFGDKTVWDWLQLLSALAIPVVLAGAGLWFTAQQDARQQNIEDQRTEQAQKIESQRAEAERKLVEQRAQDEALQSYLNQMSQLMLDRKLLETEQGDPVHTLAQARTSTVILRLDAEHNESVTRFLINSGLAVSSEASPKLLREITLSHATLSDAFLEEADLSGADLSYADLTFANLSDANLRNAELSNLDLFGAILSDANLSDAYLRDAYLRGADLRNADLSDANLFGANLNNANLSDADLSDANLRNAELSEPNILRNLDLFGADLRNANLSAAYLRNADLSGAYLRNANLSAAQSITSEELEQQAASLKGATMPNGQKYEVWLKDKESQGEDE